jgi:hypothetical protein
MTPYVYNYFRNQSANEILEAQKKSDELVDSIPSITAETKTPHQQRRGSVTTVIPAGATYEMYGNYYKIHQKGEKRFVLAWGLDEWRLSNISFKKLKRFGKSVKFAA